jgi:hypothetical protein
MNTSTLPRRFTEASFRRYEDMIRRVVNAWPLLYYIDPTPLSSITYECRFRDAMRSLKENRWETIVDMKKFLEIHPNLTVSNCGSILRCGPSEVIQAERQSQAANGPAYSPVGKPIDRTSAFTGLTYEALVGLVHLAAGRHLPVPLIVRSVDPTFFERLKRLEDTLDVSIEQNPDGSLTII